MEELKAKFEKVQDEHFHADEELHDVKEQYNRLLITGKQIEADLTEHHAKLSSTVSYLDTE